MENRLLTEAEIIHQIVEKKKKKEERAKLNPHVVVSTATELHTFSLFLYLSHFFTIFSHFSTRSISRCFCWSGERQTYNEGHCHMWKKGVNISHARSKSGFATQAKSWYLLFKHTGRWQRFLTGAGKQKYTTCIRNRGHIVSEFGNNIRRHNVRKMREREEEGTDVILIQMLFS